MEDTDLMPFGKHKGTPMSKVPVTYLHWFYTKSKEVTGDGIRVREYIKNSLDALKMENRDLIW